jgi:hypothetical protein
MLTAFPITAKRKPGEAVTVVVPIYSTEPGTVTASAPGCTFPDGNTKVIAGTREYRLDGRGGDYLAKENFAQSRDDVTFLFVVDWDRIVGSRTSVAALITQGGLIGSWRVDAPALCNWSIHARRYTSSGSASAISMIYAQSVNSGVSVAAAVTYNAASGYTPNAGPERWAITKSAAGVINLHRAVRGVVATATIATTGTMGGTEALIMQGGQAASKILRICSNAELDAWFAAGTIPATNQEFSYLGRHEIVNGAQKIWDSTGTNDLTEYQVPLWQAPGMTIRNVDSVPVVPASSIRVTIPAGVASPVTLTLTRPRQGVPARASEAERIESTTGTITLEAESACFGIGPDVSASSLTWPIIRRVAVFAESDDPVSLTSDDVRVTVPASVTPVDGLALVEVTILAPVSGVTLEATQGTATADCSVTATEAALVPVPEIEPNDTLNLFPRWLRSEPHAIGLSAVLDFARAAWTDTMLPSLLIYDVDNQTSEILDLVAEAFSIYGWNKAAGEAEKIAFLRISLKIQRKIGTGYAVKQAIRLVCDDSKIEDIIITEGTGGIIHDGTYLHDGTILHDSHYHWARFDVTIETTDAAYFTDAIKASITSMINHYKPVSRWLESLIITEI